MNYLLYIYCYNILQKALESYELSNLAELQKMISQLQTKIDKTRQKIVAANAAEDPLTEV